MRAGKVGPSLVRNRQGRTPMTVRRSLRGPVSGTPVEYHDPSSEDEDEDGEEEESGCAESVSDVRSESEGFSVSDASSSEDCDFSLDEDDATPRRASKRGRGRGSRSGSGRGRSVSTAAAVTEGMVAAPRRPRARGSRRVPGAGSGLGRGRGRGRGRGGRGPSLRARERDVDAASGEDEEEEEEEKEEEVQPPKARGRRRSARRTGGAHPQGSPSGNDVDANAVDLLSVLTHGSASIHMPEGRQGGVERARVRPAPRTRFTASWSAKHELGVGEKELRQALLPGQSITGDNGEEDGGELQDSPRGNRRRGGGDESDGLNSDDPASDASDADVYLSGDSDSDDADVVSADGEEQPQKATVQAEIVTQQMEENVLITASQEMQRLVACGPIEVDANHRVIQPVWPTSEAHDELPSFVEVERKVRHKRVRTDPDLDPENSAYEPEGSHNAAVRLDTMCEKLRQSLPSLSNTTLVPMDELTRVTQAIITETLIIPIQVLQTLLGAYVKSMVSDAVIETSSGNQTQKLYCISKQRPWTFYEQELRCQRTRDMYQWLVVSGIRCVMLRDLSGFLRAEDGAGTTATSAEDSDSDADAAPAAAMKRVKDQILAALSLVCARFNVERGTSWDAPKSLPDYFGSPVWYSALGSAFTRHAITPAVAFNPFSIHSVYQVGFLAEAGVVSAQMKRADDMIEAAALGVDRDGQVCERFPGCDISLAEKLYATTAVRQERRAVIVDRIIQVQRLAQNAQNDLAELICAIEAGVAPQMFHPSPGFVESTMHSIPGTGDTSGAQPSASASSPTSSGSGSAGGKRNATLSEERRIERELILNEYLTLKTAFEKLRTAAVGADATGADPNPHQGQEGASKDGRRLGTAWQSYLGGTIISLQVAMAVARAMWLQAEFNNHSKNALLFMNRTMQAQKSALQTAGVRSGIVTVNNQIRNARLVCQERWPDSGRLYITLCMTMQRMREGELTVQGGNIIQGMSLYTRDTSYRKRNNNFQTVTLAGPYFAIRVSLPGMFKGKVGKAAGLSAHITTCCSPLTAEIVKNFLLDFMQKAGFPTVTCTLDQNKVSTGQATLKLPFIINNCGPCLRQPPSKIDRMRLPIQTSLEEYNALTPQMATVMAEFIVQGRTQRYYLPMWVSRRIIARSLRVAKWFQCRVNQASVSVGLYSSSIVMNGKGTTTDFVVCGIAMAAVLWEQLKHSPADLRPLPGCSMEDTEAMVKAMCEQHYNDLNFMSASHSVCVPPMDMPTRDMVLILQQGKNINKEVGECIREAVIESAQLCNASDVRGYTIDPELYTVPKNPAELGTMATSASAAVVVQRHPTAIMATAATPATNEWVFW